MINDKIHVNDILSEIVKINTSAHEAAIANQELFFTRMLKIMKNPNGNIGSRTNPQIVDHIENEKINPKAPGKEIEEVTNENENISISELQMDIEIDVIDINKKKYNLLKNL